MVLHKAIYTVLISNFLRHTDVYAEYLSKTKGRFVELQMLGRKLLLMPHNVAMLFLADMKSLGEFDIIMGMIKYRHRAPICGPVSKN